MTLTKTVWATAVAAALAVTSLSAHADKKDLVQKVLTLQQGMLDDLSRNIAEQPARQMAANVRQIMAQAVPEEKRDATGKQIEVELKKYVESATPIIRAATTKAAQSTIGSALDEKFNEDELKQLAAMLDSPTYKKFQTVIPEASKGLLEKIQAESSSQIMPKLQQLEASVRKILEGATGAKFNGGGAPAPAAAPAPAPAAKPAAKK